MRSRYYGTPESLPFAEALAVYEYIVPRLGTSIHRHGHYLIDRDALLTPANLDCFHCHLVHGHNCCENGQPYSMHGENLDTFNEHALPILEAYTQDGRVEAVKKNGVFEQNAHTNHYPSIRKYKGDCLYLIEADGKRLCAIHRYALAKGLDPARIKPFSCSLFPLEIIESDLGLLITSLTPETEAFSRWGDYYRRKYACVNPKRRPDGTPERHFAQADYVPAWNWARDLLISYWGEETVRDIETFLV
ncbi:DUF3109 family protein [Aneurinibacillus sp. BA2021]|nr:DUF3109 family protein [Aneurinibacillus sp. BA2021]